MEILRRILKHKIVILNEKEFENISSDNEVILHGYDDLYKPNEGLNEYCLKVFRERVWFMCGVCNDKPRHKEIILVQRVPPHSFYLSEECDQRFKGGGSERRSIPNHEELKTKLTEKFGNRFKNVILDNMLFENQVKLFYSAEMVIAQHGASLTNVLWMVPNSKVIEIKPLSYQEQCFTFICEFANHQHIIFPQDYNHAPINVNKFMNQIFNN